MHRIEAGKTRIGWIGTGVMGRWMCQHIMARGFAAAVYSRTREKSAPLLAEGASWKDSPAAVADASDVVFTMVGTPEDVRSIYFGETGIFEGTSTGKILVDMTTTRPAWPKRFSGRRKPMGPTHWMRRYRAETSGRGRPVSPSWSVGPGTCSTVLRRCLTSWGGRSCIRGAPERGSMPRCAIRS